jgi:hypothetical protein
MTFLGLFIGAAMLALAAIFFAGLLVLLKVVFWLILLPFRLLIWLVTLPFLLLKAVFVGVSAAFVVGLLTIVGLVLLVAAALAIAVPLLPFAFIAFIVWLIVRVIVRDGSPLHRSSTPRGQVSN